MSDHPQHDTDAWHELRRSGLGGSDLPAVLGISPYEGSTPLRLWQLKRNLALPSPGNDATRRGQELEGAVLDRLCAVAAVERGPALPFVRHPRWEEGVRLLANLDGTTDSPHVGGILEAKTTGPITGVAATYRRGGVPLAHLLQVHHYGACTGRTWALVGCLIGAGEPGACQLAAVHVELHPVLIGLLEEAGADWWGRYVVAGEPPPLARHPLAFEILAVSREVRLTAVYHPGASR